MLERICRASGGGTGDLVNRWISRGGGLDSWWWSDFIILQYSGRLLFIPICHPSSNQEETNHLLIPTTTPSSCCCCCLPAVHDLPRQYILELTGQVRQEEGEDEAMENNYQGKICHKDKNWKRDNGPPEEEEEGAAASKYPCVRNTVCE